MMPQGISMKKKNIQLHWPGNTLQGRIERADPPKTNLLVVLTAHAANPSPCRVQVRPGQVRSGQVRSGQARSGQVRSGQARPGQVRSGQARPGQVQARYVVSTTLLLLLREARRGQERPGEA